MEKLTRTFDELSGVETTTGVDQLTNRFVIKHRGDIEQSIEYAKALQNDDDVWKDGVKKGWAMCGHIPAMTVIELMNIGINIYTAPMKDIRAGLEKLGKPGFVWKS
jgi:hypothetical protein